LIIRYGLLGYAVVVCLCFHAFVKSIAAEMFFLHLLVQLFKPELVECHLCVCFRSLAICPKFILSENQYDEGRWYHRVE
jgi:hypothetical protein